MQSGWKTQVVSTPFESHVFSDLTINQGLYSSGQRDHCCLCAFPIAGSKEEPGCGDQELIDIDTLISMIMNSNDFTPSSLCADLLSWYAHLLLDDILALRLQVSASSTVITTLVVV